MTQDPKPVLIVDTREQTPLVFRTLPSVVGSLVSGDYSVAGLESVFAVERKSVPDLVACCVGENRERFERELQRLRGHRFARLLIVGCRAEVEQHRYRSNVSPKAVLHSLAAWEARFIPIVWEPDPESAARRIEAWAFWFSREVAKEYASLVEGSALASLTVNKSNTPQRTEE